MVGQLAQSFSQYVVSRAAEKVPKIFLCLGFQSDISRYALQPTCVHRRASAYIVPMYALKLTSLGELLSSILACPVIVNTVVSLVVTLLCPELRSSDCPVITLVV